jgi:predicted Zn-dependent peptidase
MNRIGMQKFVLVLGMMSLLAAPAFAQETVPDRRSAEGIRAPAPRRHLANGMKVTLVPYGSESDGKPCVRRAPKSRHRSNTAWPPFWQPAEEGQTKGAKQLAEEFPQMGGDLNVGIGEDESAFTTDVLSEFGPNAVKLLADVALHPLLPESEMARLKNDAVRQVTIARSIPQQIAGERFRKILYPDHPYGRILPAAEDIQKQTAANAKAFYEANFVASRAHLYVAGRFDGAAVKKAITEGFSSWTKGTAAATAAPKTQAKRVLDVTDRPGAAQSTIFVAARSKRG